MKGNWILSNALSPSTEIIMSFSMLLMWCFTRRDFHMLNHSCVLSSNYIWSWCVILLTCCCISFANISLRSFALMYMMGLSLHFSHCFFFRSSYQGLSECLSPVWGKIQEDCFYFLFFFFWSRWAYSATLQYQSIGDGGERM